LLRLLLLQEEVTSDMTQAVFLELPGSFLIMFNQGEI
jgi:hypothetical protein